MTKKNDLIRLATRNILDLHGLKDVGVRVRGHRGSGMFFRRGPQGNPYVRISSKVDIWVQPGYVFERHNFPHIFTDPPMMSWATSMSMLIIHECTHAVTDLVTHPKNRNIHGPEFRDNQKILVEKFLEETKGILLSTEERRAS